MIRKHNISVCSDEKICYSKVNFKKEVIMKISKILLVVSLIVVTTFFLVGAQSRDLSYADGYHDGKRAASADVNPGSKNYCNTGYTGYFTLPDYRLDQIRNRSSSYQQGFRAGYRDCAKEILNAKSDWGCQSRKKWSPEFWSPEFWFSITLSMLLFSSILSAAQS